MCFDGSLQRHRETVCSGRRESNSTFPVRVEDARSCECVSHVLQTLTDLDPTATILSLDGVGAFDLVSRNAMLKGLLAMESGDRFLPFQAVLWRRVHFPVGK